MSPTTLYRFFDADDRLLYVGISLSVVERLRAHRSDKHWFPDLARATFENFDSRREAAAAELAAIKAEKPIYNVAGSVGPRPEPALWGRVVSMEPRLRMLKRRIESDDRVRLPLELDTIFNYEEVFNEIRSLVGWGRGAYWAYPNVHGVLVTTNDGPVEWGLEVEKPLRPLNVTEESLQEWKTARRWQRRLIEIFQRREVEAGRRWLFQSESYDAVTDHLDQVWQARRRSA